MLLIRGGTIVDRGGKRTGDLLIAGERIAELGPRLEPEGADVFDATGALVIPGGIDVHTHFDLLVGAVRSADDFESGTVAAACGGTTCVVDFAGAGRETPQEALDEWHARARGKAAVDYGFHLTVTSVPESADQARLLFRWFTERGVASVKLYMAYPDRLMVDDETLRRALAASVGTGVLVCVHAEDGADVERRTADVLRGGSAGPEGLARARPPEVEAAAVRRAAGLALREKASLYVVHLSSAAGLAEVRQAASSGARVLAETCPQYLFLTAECLGGEPRDAANFVCTPPLRSDADRAALWAAVAEGSVQVVSTDHCPFRTDDRRRGVRARDEGWAEFTDIPGGLPGVESRLSLGYQGVRDGRMSVERWVDAMAGAPARLFGLAHHKGSLEPGLDADVVVFDPGATRRLDPGNLHMRTDHSPYEGLEVVGWPALTLVRGRIVARSGEPVDAEPGWGRFVPRRLGPIPSP